MKKNILFISLILLLFNNDIFSQNIKITGKIHKSESESESLVRLLTFNDMLTFEQTTIFETQSDKDGNFTIDANIEEITLAQIAVDLDRVDILLNPNSTYEVEIIIPKQDDNISYFERQTPTLKIIKADDNDLYYQYSMSEMIIDDFLLDNFNLLYRARKISLLDSLEAKIKRNLGELKSDFVKDNLRYRKASMQMVANNDNGKKVISQHFNKQDILYSQPAYMNLFQEVFTNYLSSIQSNPSELRYQLYSDHDTFLKYIKGNDAFLAENPNLAEIIIAWELKRWYYEIPDDRVQVIKHLNSIAQNTKSQKNKAVVNDILKQINRLSFNADAPAFSLQDKDGKTVKSSDLKDNMILLQFVNQVSAMTDHQFNTLKDLSQQWNDTIQVVTIATKECFDDFRQIFDNKGYNWNLLNLGNDILLLEEYQIRTFPDYIILGKNNKIGMAPAPSPDQHLDFHVRRLYNYYKNK
ncbi:MAG: redoxin domain-containing protein [Bacteroidales bacterium]|nr:redoxin domain-containing protein [Bacteroidales bacterium]